MKIAAIIIYLPQKRQSSLKFRHLRLQEEGPGLLTFTSPSSFSHYVPLFPLFLELTCCFSFPNTILLPTLFLP